MTQVLVPTLRPGDVVVMDNLAAHKVAGIETAITRTGAKLVYLPPYSPDWSPIDRAGRRLNPGCAGCRYQEVLISAREETALVGEIATLPLKPYEFRGFFAKRNVIAFGFRYDYQSHKMVAAPDFPPFLDALRIKVASFANKSPEDFRQVLITEYTPRTALAWHRDRLQYDEIVGVSLLSAGDFRVRRNKNKRWMRASKIIAPRSA